MDKEIHDKLIKGYIVELAKPRINKFERAEIIKMVMRTEKLSARAFGKKYGINKSTIDDWLLWLKITENKYNELISDGISHTDIYKTLRDNKDLPGPQIVFYSRFDRLLDQTKHKVGGAIRNTDLITNKTADIAKDLINNLNRLLIRCDKKFQNG